MPSAKYVKTSSIQLESLRPLTSYTFIVYAENDLAVEMGAAKNFSHSVSFQTRKGGKFDVPKDFVPITNANNYF